MAAADIVRGVTSGSSGSGTSTNSQVVVTAPAGLQSGDKLAVIMSFRTAVPAASAPAGWTLANAGSTADASGEGYIYTAEYGTDVTGSSWTFNSADTATANKLAWACVALKGTSAGAKQVSLFGVKSTTATTNPTGTLTTTAPAHIIALSGDRQSSGSTWTWPAGWVEQADVAGTGTNGASSTIAVYDTTPAAAGNYSVTPTALNSGSNAWWGLIAYSVASGGNPSTIAVDLSGTGTLTASVQGPSTLPGPIDGIEPEGHTHVPVYCDANGNLYRVTEEYGIPVEPHNTARMMKSADGGKTWAEVDQANRPPAADLEGVWLLQVGTELWWSHTNGGFVSFSIFNTSDAATNPDKWAVRDERPVTGLSAGSQQFSSLARISDGRAWVFYSDTLSGTNKQLAYIRRTGTNTWTAPTKIGTTSDSLTGPMSVVGKNDVTHIVYHDYANKQLLWRTLTAAGVLSAATRIDTSGTNTATRNYNAATAPVYYDAAGAEVITVAFASASGIRTVTITNGTPAAEQVITSSAPKISPPNGIDGNTGNDGPALHLAVDGTTVHAIWADDTTGDLMHSSRPHGGSWATPDVLWDAPGTDYVAWTYCNVYTRGGAKKLGYTYDHAPHADNDSNIWFNELALAAGPVTVDVNLSGTGALTATLSAPTTSKSAALSGTGALTATATAPTTSASAALSGTGALTATVTAPTTTKTAALSGTGALTATATAPTTSKSAALSGTGALTATVASSGPTIPVALSGTGALTATASAPTTTKTAALSGTGALAATVSSPSTTLSVALSGTGALAATATPVAATPFVENFEGGTNGAAITNVNSGFSVVDAGFTFTDTPAPVQGALAAAVVAAASSTIAARTPVTPSSAYYRRAYVYLPANPASVSSLLTARSAGVAVGAVRITATGTVQLRDGSTTVWTSPSSLPLNEWVRLEWRIEGAQQQVRVFTGNNRHGTTPDQDSGLVAYTAAALDEHRLGISNGSTTSSWTVYYDAIEDSTQTWPTPLAGPVVLSAALSGTGALAATVSAPKTTVSAALSGTGALTATATVVGGPPDTPTLLARPNKIAPTGTFTDKWAEAAPTADRTFDFRGAEFRGFFLADPVLGYKQWDTANGGTAATAHEKNNTPFDIAGSTPATRAAIIGGKVLGDQARTYTWNSHKHGTPAQDDLDAGISPTTVWNTWASKNTDGDPRIRVAQGSWVVVDGLRVDNSHDGFGIYSATNSLADTGKVYLRNCWVNFCHDDAIENDRGYLTLEVDDCLFEDIHGFISVSGASTPATPDPTKVQTVRNSIISFKPKPGPYQQKTSVLGHGGVYKDQSNSPPLVMSDTIIAVEKFANASSQANLPTAAGCSYTNVTIVWLGQGAYPGNVPAGCTLTTDRSVLDNAVANWKARHGVTNFDTVDMNLMIAPLATAPTSLSAPLTGTGSLSATLSAPKATLAASLASRGELAATVSLLTILNRSLSGSGALTVALGLGPPVVSYDPVTAELVDAGVGTAELFAETTTAELFGNELGTAELFADLGTVELLSQDVYSAELISEGVGAAILDSDGIADAVLYKP